LHHQPACYLYFSLAVVPGLTQHLTVAALLFASVLMICHFHLFVLRIAEIEPEIGFNSKFGFSHCN
jgi:hypothetical protein